MTSVGSPPADREETGFSPWLLPSVLKRHMWTSVVVAVAVGAVTHFVGSSFLSAPETVYVAKAEVSYRSGTNLLQGISQLVGKDLPSLRTRSSIETQMRTLRSKKLRDAAVRRMEAKKVLSKKELENTSEYEVDVTHLEDTTIMVLSVRGKDKKGVEALAQALIEEYIEQDVQIKRAKDLKLLEYVDSQIDVQEQKIRELTDILKEHEEVGPREKARDRAIVVARDAQLALVKEQRKRENVRDALLERYTKSHPAFVKAQKAVTDIKDIMDAPDADALHRFRVGGEARWAALQQEALTAIKRKNTLEGEIAKIRADIGEQYEATLNAGSDLEHVQREHKLAQEIYIGLRRRENQVELSIRDTSSDAHIVQEPTLGQVPDAWNWHWAVVAGLILGLLSPFVAETLMATSHTFSDLERTSGLKTLAVLPKVDQNGNGTALIPPGSAASDELRLLRTNLESTLEYPTHRLILIASAEPGEGKSLISLNLAATYAEMGYRTLLVDLDLRRPSVHNLLKLRRSPGVVEVIDKQVSWRRAVQIPPGKTNLHILSAGGENEDPGGVLATIQMSDLLKELRDTFPVVICDSPAVLAVTDTPLVTRCADAVVLVYALSSTTHRALSMTMSMLSTAQAKVMGVVCNDVRGLSWKPYRYRRYYYR